MDALESINKPRK